MKKRYVRILECIEVNLVCWIMIIMLIMIFYFPEVFALKIIPETGFENDSLTICSDLYNSSSSNKTLDCVNFFISLQGQNTTIKTIVNHTGEYEEYIEKRIAEKVAEYPSYEELNNIIEERFTILNNKVNESDCPPGSRCARDYELELKKLELGKQEPENPPEQEETFTKEEMERRIVEAISKSDPAKKEIEEKEEPDYFFMFGIILAIIFIASIVLKKFNIFGGKPVYIPPKPKKPAFNSGIKPY